MSFPEPFTSTQDDGRKNSYPSMVSMYRSNPGGGLVNAIASFGKVKEEEVVKTQLAAKVVVRDARIISRRLVVDEEEEAQSSSPIVSNAFFASADDENDILLFLAMVVFRNR